MKLGARIIKTGISVATSLYISQLLGLSPVVFAALAAVLALQPSLYRSWQNVLDQLQANIIGAIMAILFTYFLGNGAFVVGLVVIIVIAINLQLRLEKSIPLSIVTVIAIMGSPSDSFIWFALERFTLILTGLTASVVVNFVFIPPKYEDKVYSKIKEINQGLLSYLRTCTTQEINDKLYREDTKRLKDELAELDQIYLLYKEERTYLRKISYSKTRKLVLFRKMLSTAKKALTLLTYIERHQAELEEAPKEICDLIQKEIDILCNYHQKILMKYEEKIKVHHPHVPHQAMYQGRKVLIQHFMSLYEVYKVDPDEPWLELFPLISHILDYSNELERLDKLVEGYYSFHSKNKSDQS